MTALTIDLRLGRQSDALTIALMSRHLIEAGLGWRYRPDVVRRMIDDPETIVLIACSGACPVGFAIMKFGEERAHLVLFAVQPAYQRRGIGRRLFDWLVESALTAGIASIHLELRADNRSARWFYRRLGFAETLKIPGYYQGREAAIRMVRTLRCGSASSFRWQPPRRRA